MRNFHHELGVTMLARQIAIGSGIAIVFPLLVYYGVRTFYSPPQWPTEVYSAQATPEERQRQRERREAYIAQSREFARVLIIASTPLGIAAILIGTFVSLPALGTGLILGGIFTVAHGYWGYWQYADDWLRFVSLLLGFAVLLFVAYRRWPTSESHSP
jgi:uncharacterized membrane protein YphA (DoxX/SURF4 family)